MDLCRRCGLCCDGTLFASVPVREEEARALGRLSLPVIARSDGSAALVQRCAALDGLDCRIYESRPAACRAFDCLLLRALAEGDLGLDEALGLVARARGLVAEAEALLPERARGPEPLQVRVRREHRPEEALALPDSALVAVRRASEYLDRHFRGRAMRGA